MKRVSADLGPADVWLRQMVLAQARDGNLRATWRHELSLSKVMVGSEVVPESIHTAVKKIRQMPYAAWEPDHAPDWRTALDAWYTDSREVLTQSYRENSRRLTATMEKADRVCSEVVQSWVPNDESTLPGRLLTFVVSMDDIADQERNHLEQNFAQTRDWITASYLAGLTAGGQNVDWVAWFKTRVARWPLDDQGTRRAETELNHPTFREKMERLPTYWMP